MAWTCYVCHYSMNNDDETLCLMCNAPRPGAFPASGSTASPRLPPARSEPVPVSHIPADPPGEHDGIPPSGPDHGEREIERPDSGHESEAHAGRGILRGRVSHVEQRDERPPFNLYRTLTWVLIWILIGVPFAMLFAGAAIISFSFAVIGFRTLSQFFNPLTWTVAIAEIMEVVVLRRFRSDDRIPVFRGMVEDRESGEHSFMMLGPLHRGNIFVGQNVEFAGHWHQGSFIVREGADLTTGARITSAYRDPWRMAFFLVAGLFLISVFMLYLNLDTIFYLTKLNMVR